MVFFWYTNLTLFGKLNLTVKDQVVDTTTVIKALKKAGMQIIHTGLKLPHLCLTVHVVRMSNE